MPYKIRNTIALAVILLIVLIGSVISNSSSERKIADLSKKNQELSKRLNMLNSQLYNADEEEELEQEIRELEIEISKFKKAIVKEDDKKLVSRKRMLKRKLFRVVANQTGKLFDENILTIVWARRFAGYKRANLIMENFDRFKSIVQN